MAKKYILLEVDDSGGGGGGDDVGAFIAWMLILGGIIGAVMALYAFLFGAYEDSDFNTAKYFGRARDGANELVLEWQGRNWRPRGFTDEFQVLSNEPEFKTSITDNGNQPATEYLGNGIFQVAVETSTLLKSKSGKTVTVQEGFIVQIKSDMSHGRLYRFFKGDEWRIIAAEQAYMSPTLPEINNLIAQWSSSKS